MIRVSYWQFRLPFGIALGCLAAVAVIAGLTGPGLAHLYDTTVANCASNGGDCSTALSLFNAHDQLLKVIAQAIPLSLPAILGMFWGAPLVARELESGTFRLAWTQGCSRLRWFGAKLAVVGLTALTVQGIITLALTWWWSPVGHANHNRFSPVLFGAFGVAPIGYAAFALALGITAGVVMRRTLPAMATTLAVFVGVRLAVTFWVRPYFAVPTRMVLPISPNGGIGIDSPARGQMSLNFFPPELPDAWLRSSQVTNAAGQKPSGAVLSQQCPQVLRAQIGQGNMGEALRTCMVKLSATFHQTITYQPASRYWPFQWAELGVFTALALALAAFSAWWIRRRLI
ncbi:MAG: ABC transporter permease [Trebonia sp.]|jgi:ABC-type transport system involved in multi-copper enzyme maturation permease subunit